MKVINNAKIKDYTTYKLEGTVKTIYFPLDIIELKNLISNLKNIKYKIIGNGSNLIISDKYNGVLIKLENFDKLDIEDNIVKVGSGYMLSKLALECAKANLSGLEFAYGIPATIGGAIYQNAGAFGSSMDCIIKEVLVLDEKGDIITLSKEDLKLGYRDSVLKHTKYICLEVTLSLKRNNYEKIISKMNDNIRVRKERQPIDYPSAGSVFRNPADYSAGKLIEDAGLKGTKFGGAMISLKHANFIVNIGQAKAEDIIGLIKLVQEKVKEETGILLECEQEYLE